MALWSKFRSLAILVALLTSWSSQSYADTTELTDEEKQVIGNRLARTRNAKIKQRIEVGDTIFITKSITVPRRKLPGTSLDYEGIVGAINSPPQLFIDKRIDRISFAPAPGNNLRLTIRYAVGVYPEAKKGGRISFRLSLIKRKGMGDVVFSIDGSHSIRIRRAIADTVDVAADFRAYRVYRLLAAKHAAALKMRGIRGLSLNRDARLPVMAKLKPALANGIFQFDRWRRRMWIAKRHLLELVKHPDPTIADLSATYLAALDLPENKIQNLPQIPLSKDSPQISKAKLEDVSDQTTREKSQSNPSIPSSSNSNGIVQPLSNNSNTTSTQLRTRPRPSLSRGKSKSNVNPITPSKPEMKLSPKAETIANASDEAYQRGKKRIPSHPRFLQLSDPNVTFGGAIRANYQKVTTTEAADVPTLFLEMQIALLNDLGLTFNLPLALVNVDLPRTKAIATIGNPLLEVKYRFHLPTIMGSKPNVSLRTNWSIPASHGPKISPTELTAEEFILAAQFIETTAFIYERHAIGGGVSSSWELGPVHLGGQLQLEYLLPIADGISTQSFSVISYGAGVGYRPFGDLVGFYFETQGAALLLGPRRNELTSYAGIRGRPLDFLEIASWGAVTIAPDARPTNLSFGGELRLVYDVDSVIIFGSSTRKFGDEGWTE